MFKEQMKKFELDVQKLPLGALSPVQINKGYACLDNLADAIDQGEEEELESLTSEFYRTIPHAFGRRRPPIINTAEVIQQKRDMLAVLGDIKMACTLTENVKPSDKHQYDINYELLDTDLTVLDHFEKEYQMIVNYLDSTKDRAHLQLIEAFKINRHPEPERFREHEGVGNRRLLWHGTNVAVVVAILKSGLRIMPHSGGRLGRGIYFASENAKSANYVGAAENIGIMFLSEVVLGNEHHIIQDDSTLKTAPAGFNCVIAKGWTEPDPAKDIVINIDGNQVVVPQGKPIPMNQWKGSNFTRTEYVVYKESQCRLRYLLKIKWG